MLDERGFFVDVLEPMPEFHSLTEEELDVFLEEHKDLIDSVMGRDKKTPEEPPRPGVRKCSHCDEWKDVSLFGIDRKTKDGLTYWCRECKNAKQKLNKARRKAQR